MKRHLSVQRSGFVLALWSLIGLMLVSVPMDPQANAQEVAYPDSKTTKKAKSGEAKPEGKEDEDEDAEEEAEETLEEKVKDHERIEGLFTFYRDTEDGSLLFEVSEDQMAEGVEFIYHGMVLNGAAEIGLILGGYYNPKMIRFAKHYDRIEIVQENTSFYFDPENALSRAKDANIQPALLAVASIIATSEDGTRYLIDGDSLFESEALSQVTPSVYPGHGPSGGFEPGSLNSRKTRTVYARSFPRNSTVAVDYVFDNETPTNYGKDDITNGRTVTVSFQHSFIAAPEPGYEPRIDDQRVGYFNLRVTDLTDAGPTPYRDLINRWRLVKKDPEAELSEPVKPITYWIENTTPVEYRDALVRGVLAWNSAFEKAGFKNAVEAKIMPDDATWDPADVDYNVIRWVSSPQVQYGGSGPSLANPRTGEIIAADIVLEQAYANYRVLYGDMFEDASLVPMNEPNGAEQVGERHRSYCAAARTIHANTMFGITALRAQGADVEDIKAVLREGLVELALHEVGHTLGLMHNMKATQAVAYEDIHSAETTERGYLTGSVMDYAAINVNPDRSRQGLYYSVVPGPYDDWAIEFGYRPSLSDPKAERARVEALLARSTEKELAFGNDADDMRGTRGGIDPRIMVGDLTDDALQYAIDRMSYVELRLKDLKEKFEEEGETWDNLYTAYTVLTGQKSTQSHVIANYIGGIHLERAVIGQKGADVPYRPVPGEEQRKAMAALKAHVFAPDAWDVPPELIQHLQQSRRGYEQYGKEDPRMHDRTLGMQTRIVNLLLNQRVMQRQLDSSLYGNDYPPAEVLQDLTDAIFVADLRGRVNSYRQNLQLHYVGELVKVSTGVAGHSYSLQSAALYQLKRIEKMVRQARSPDVATAAHRTHVRLWIEQSLYGEGSRL